MKRSMVIGKPIHSIPLHPLSLLPPPVPSRRSVTQVRESKRERAAVPVSTDVLEGAHKVAGWLDAGTRWITPSVRGHVNERARFFSRKNGFSVSLNSVVSPHNRVALEPAVHGVEPRRLALEHRGRKKERP